MMINKFKSLPESMRKKIITGVTGVFLTFVSLSYLLSPVATSNATSGVSLGKNQIEEIIKIHKDKSDSNEETESKETKSVSFEEAQKLVKTVEAGYSDDRGDAGNWIEVQGGRRFIGTNHGISAPILADYFKEKGIKRLITKKDMMDLSYKTPLKIFNKDYWDAQSLDLLKDQNVANVIYDGCVNQGIEGMKSVLRNALEDNGVEISDNDVIFSSEVLGKANQLNQENLFNSIKKFREERYRDSKTFGRHGDGWLNRLDDISYNGEINYKDHV
jgi:lysozyme family protein